MREEKAATAFDFKSKGLTVVAQHHGRMQQGSSYRLAGVVAGWLVIWLSGCAGFTVNKSVQAGSSSAVLSSLTCNNSSVTGTASIACTISLSSTAPAAGALLGLSSSSSAVKVPQTVTIPANETSVDFTATASAVTSMQKVTLTGTFNGLSSTFELQLNPSGPNLKLSSSTVSFGAVQLNTSATQSLTLTSSGNAALTISSATISGSGFSVSGLSLPLTLSPGKSETLNIQFVPTASGNATGQLSIKSDAMTNPTATVNLSGTGQTISYEVDLNWNAPASSSDIVAGYLVYRAVSGTAAYQLLNLTANPTTTYIDSNVQSGKSYQYYVETIDLAGLLSGPSNIANVSIP